MLAHAFAAAAAAAFVTMPLAGQQPPAAAKPAEGFDDFGPLLHVGGPTVVPRPRAAGYAPGTMELTSSGAIVCEANGADHAGAAWLLRHARVLREELELLSGVRLAVGAVADASDVATITLRLRPLPARDDVEGAFLLEVTQVGAIVTAGTTHGIACGSARLLQLLRNPDGEPCLHAARIEDQPAHTYRSVMIDVARQPHSIAVLEDVIRLARLYSLRYVQLHLTDDQNFCFPFAPVTDQLDHNASYTRYELLALVQYAEDRGITLIPEIDLPGHSARLRASGYLGKDVKSDRDLAANEAAFPAIARLLDEVIEVFAPSPFLHIGGDESGAGDALVPFLARVHRHVTRRHKRLIVWEGFHGAPIDQLPATGPDRILVASWESSYNPPWQLLEAGYELINASWRPLYVVGGHSLVHPGSTAGRRWQPRELAAWNPKLFQHWEPGRPVYEDRGPADEDRTDHSWSAAAIGRGDQVVGGQISVWEQRESSVVEGLRLRLPIVADRLWGAPPAERDLANPQWSEVEDLLERVRVADRIVFGVVQPVAIEVAEHKHSAGTRALYVTPADGERIRLRARVAVPGKIVIVQQPFRPRFDWIDFPQLAAPGKEGAVYREPIPCREGLALRASFVRADGSTVGGGTWGRLLKWPPRVRVRAFDLVRDHGFAGVPDLLAEPLGEPFEHYSMPMLRGPLCNTHLHAQVLEATLVIPTGGAVAICMKTQSGRASLRLDVDGDGKFCERELLIDSTPASEAWVEAAVALRAGVSYALRVDHLTGLPRPVLSVAIRRTADGKREDVSPFLQVLAESRSLRLLGSAATSAPTPSRAAAGGRCRWWGRVRPAVASGRRRSGRGRSECAVGRAAAAASLVASRWLNRC